MLMYLFYYPVNASTAQELLLPVPDTYKLFFTLHSFSGIYSPVFSTCAAFLHLCWSVNVHRSRSRSCGISYIVSMSALAVRPHLHSYLDSTSRL